MRRYNLAVLNVYTSIKKKENRSMGVFTSIEYIQLFLLHHNTQPKRL